MTRQTVAAAAALTVAFMAQPTVAAQSPPIAAGTTAAGVVAVRHRGGTVIAAFVAHRTTPGGVRLSVRWCDAPAQCVTARHEGAGTIDADGAGVRLSVPASPLGTIDLRASIDRAISVVGSCEFTWARSDSPDRGRVVFERYGNGVAALWTGSIGSGTTSPTPGDACGSYQQLGITTMRG